MAFGVFVLTDLTFLGAVSLKLVEGAWLPLAIAAGVYLLMETWRAGRRVLLEKAYGGGHHHRSLPRARRQDADPRIGHRRLHYAGAGRSSGRASAQSQT